MKLGCSSWSYHRAFEARKLNIKKWISICADDLMLDGVELLDFHLNKPGIDFKELKNFIVAKGLTISSVSVSNNFGYESDGKLKEEVAKVKRWINITSLFGASILRVFAGWAGSAPWDDNFSSEIADRNILWPRMIECMKECVDYAEHAGIVLAVENHNHRGFIHTAEDSRRIVREINSSWFKLNLDIAGYTEDIYTAIEDTLDLAVQVHIKILEPSADVIDKKLDYNRIFTILNGSNYRGFLSLEYEGEEDEFITIPKLITAIKNKMI
jgi:L-ribulose-5-phosphate 3-epimerase